MALATKETNLIRAIQAVQSCFSEVVCDMQVLNLLVCHI